MPNLQCLHKQKLYIQHYKDKLLRCKTYAIDFHLICDRFVSHTLA